ncbi:NAD(P)H-binding protein [Candidatus Uabimicrobium amorphum]|uniref:Nucleoside-diphosphate sugar epimerase n=1 Tax=Uabimicrobium amorphum TaxID=2596890 RepID=A0A5S9IUU1_UABAM|nr:NAD(P)H-binding protein [Candidatus Uabimicrobium amorphum]BBM87940.1 nucleoside-diphosphate sugar epimerase [Candidatus Uabimicrobium amorphum]
MKKIAIAGANGFIGQALLEKLSPSYHIVALSRNVSSQKSSENIEWRSCDLYSMLDAEKGLEGVDYAIYLVHSMMPSARLTQGSFSDTDLVLADNFARAANKVGVKQIIYLGGIIPDEGDPGDLSSHLKSRLEVEVTLSSYGVPLTAIRTAMIVGPGGSSFHMLEKLVRRLPVMICPQWTLSKTQPIALQDVIAGIEQSIGDERFFHQEIELGGPDIFNYQRLLKLMAKALGKRRLLITVPLFTAKLSTLWVSLVTGTSRKLVAPLIQSLRHDMVAKDHPLKQELKLPQIPFEKSVREAIDLAPKKSYKRKKFIPRASDVRSIQRLPLPPGKDASWVAKEYSTWLDRYMKGILFVKNDDKGNSSFYLRFFKRWPLLILTLSPERSSENRYLFYITGGILAKTTDRGRLEFREVMQGKYIIAAIHDFCPTLPWYIYNISQAWIHLWVMNRFGNYLRNYSGEHHE